MNVKPTQDRRSVLLSLQFVKSAATKTGNQPSEILRIASISALFAAPDDIKIEIFDNSDEAALLTRFWRSLRQNDQIYAADVTNAFSFLRRRSWLLDVIPAPDIDLRCVYAIELWDSARMWTKDYSPLQLYLYSRADFGNLEIGAPIDAGSGFVHSGTESTIDLS